MIRYALLGLVVLASAGPLFAQYAPPGYPPYGGTVVYPRSYGDVLRGSAEVTNAYANQLVQTEQARILREKAAQEKINTQKKAFDQMLYEKAHTLTYLEELSADKAALLTRLINYPIKGEIVNGTTLNAMLPLVRDLSSGGTQGPPVPLPQSIVNQLNIAGVSTGSIGMLKAGGALEWPPSLRGPQQEKLDKLLPLACSACAAGTLTSKQLKEIRKETDIMRETLRRQLQKDEIESSAYFAGLEFHGSLVKSLNALERPDARKQMTGGLSPRARNVQELVDFMTDNGVQFAAASPGSEDAYQVSHDAFVRYVRSAGASSGLQVVGAPIAAPSSKKK